MDLSSPLKKPAFKRYWNIILEGIVDRDNLKAVHLQQMKLLCDLYLEYDKLSAILEEKGYTYMSDGRHGIQEKERLEVKIRSGILSQIVVYSKLLGLVLVKDNSKKSEPPSSDWDV